MAVTGAGLVRNVLRGFHPSTSQNLMVLSELPPARMCPSGLKATPLTQLPNPASGGPISVGGPGRDKSHRLIVLSLLPAANIRLSGLKAIESTVVPDPFGSSASRTGGVPVVLHSRTVPSVPPAATIAPSGLKTTDWVVPSAGIPVSGARTTGWLGSFTSQRRTPTAVPPAAKVWPSGLNVTDCTAPAKPVKASPSRRGRAGSATSHSRTAFSVPPTATIEPFGLNATAKACDPGLVGTSRRCFVGAPWPGIEKSWTEPSMARLTAMVWPSLVTASAVAPGWPSRRIGVGTAPESNSAARASVVAEIR